MEFPGWSAGAEADENLSRGKNYEDARLLLESENRRKNASVDSRRSKGEGVPGLPQQVISKGLLTAVSCHLRMLH